MGVAKHTPVKIIEKKCDELSLVRSGIVVQQDHILWEFTRMLILDCFQGAEEWQSKSSLSSMRPSVFLKQHALVVPKYYEKLCQSIFLASFSLDDCYLRCSLHPGCDMMDPFSSDYLFFPFGMVARHEVYCHSILFILIIQQFQDSSCTNVSHA